MKLSFVSAALLISVLSTDAQYYGPDPPSPVSSESQSYVVSSNYEQVHVPQQSNYKNPPNPNMESYYGSVPPAESTQPLPGDRVQTQYVPAAAPSFQHFAGPASFPPQQVSSTAYAQSASPLLAPRAPCACAQRAPAAGVARPPCPCASRTPAAGAPRAPCAGAPRAPAASVPRAPCPCALRAPAAGAPRAPCACAQRAPAASVPRVPVVSVQRAPAASVPRAPCASVRAPCASAPRAPAASVPRAPCACARAPCACARAPASAPRAPAASAKRTSAQYTRAAFPQLGPSTSLSSDGKLPGTSELPVSEEPESAATGTPDNSDEKTSTSIDQTSQKSSLNKPQEVEIKASH